MASSAGRVPNLKVAFVHPDLGLGGAERLIVDSAVGLKQLGHEPCIYTAYFDPQRCFEDVAKESLRVEVVGSWIPRKLFGRFQAILTAIQCMYIALYICIFRSHDFNVAICDVVTLPNIVFHIFSKPVVFYCHFPDKYLATSLALSSSETIRKPFHRRLYRRVVDGLEEYCLKFSKAVLVNSDFTANILKQAFPSLDQTAVVVHPSVPLIKSSGADAHEKSSRLVLLSLNRYERKKRVDTAVRALKKLQSLVPGNVFENVELIVAGGWDPRLDENVLYEQELKQLVCDLSLEGKVTFLKNISESKRQELMNLCLCLLYTPPNEHFGIVPLEAMVASKPVLACDSGGPLETVEHGKSGFHCNPTPQSFAEACFILVMDPAKGSEMGHRGRERVERCFSRPVFAKKLEACLFASSDLAPTSETRKNI